MLMFVTTNVKWFCVLTTNEYDRIHFKIDTEGGISVIPLSVYRVLKCKPQMQKSSTIINGLGGTVVKPVGKVTVPVKVKDISHVLHVEVVDAKVPCILSNSDSLTLVLVKRIYHTLNAM